MARVSFLLPRDDMLPYVPALAEKYHLEVLEVRTIQTSQAVEAANHAMEAGADIVIARGLQAELIRSSTTVPLVNIQLTAQEVALLVHRAKRLTSRQLPRIALVGLQNMFQDVSHLGQLLGVDLRTYFPECYADSNAFLEQGAAKACSDGADVLIGGDVVCQYAEERGLPSIFIDSSPECIENACRTAQRMAYALDLEKRNNAQLQSILDYTVNGLILIDAHGVIQQLNPSSEHLLDPYQRGLIGKAAGEIFPSLTQELLEEVLIQGHELPIIHLRLGDMQVAASVSPVTSGDEITGAVISITDSKQLKLYTNRERIELLHQGFSAPFTFDSIIVRAPKMLAVIEQAKRCAAFQAPVLILGEFGTERRELAQCIHNAGQNRENALVQFRCNCADPKIVEEHLFGPNGLVEQAQGTIFLDEVSCLSRFAQSKLLRLIPGHSALAGGTGSLPRLRVLAGDRRDLAQLAEREEFDRELYYALSITVLTIPPLRQRPEDIIPLADYFLRTFQERYGRYLHLTKTAWQRLRSYSWPGNLPELSSICQRIVVNAPRRTVDEFFLDTLLDSSDTPAPQPAVPATVVYQDPNAVRITELLAACHGNRRAAAQALGVSTTTLWRRMKKYGIQA